METKTDAPVEFPVPDFDGPTVVFGANHSAYLTREQLGPEFYGMRNEWAKAASELFFRGGKIDELGLKFRDGINPDHAYRALQALLCSFAPKHEIKIGTVGYALSQWCEKIPKDVAP